MRTEVTQTPTAESPIGMRIRAIRRNWKWSQARLAEALMVDQASISFWERDKIVPSGSAMVALAALFRTSVTALEKGEGFVVPDPPSKMDPNSKPTRGEIPRSVALPPIQEEDVIAIVDLKDGSSKSKQLSEAMMVLVQGVKDGRRVWVVME